MQLVEVGRTDPGGGIGLAEGLEALLVAAFVGLEDRAGLLRAAECGVAGKAEQVKGAAQRVDDPAVVIGVCEPLHRQAVPEKGLHPFLGQDTEPLAGGQPLERRFSIANGVAVFGCERGESLLEHGVVVRHGH